jgi:hypothetical protein
VPAIHKRVIGQRLASQQKGLLSSCFLRLLPPVYSCHTSTHKPPGVGLLDDSRQTVLSPHNSPNGIPRIGQIAGVRQRLYLTEQTTPPAQPGDSTLVSLSCIEDDAHGQPLEVLWEQELDARILSGEAWDSSATRGFDPGGRFSAYLSPLRWNCVTSTDPRLLQSPFRAGIRLDAYQL